jgi:hypothetical protein
LCIKPFYCTFVHERYLLKNYYCILLLIKKSHIFVNHPSVNDLQKYVSSYMTIKIQDIVYHMNPVL